MINIATTQRAAFIQQMPANSAALFFAQSAKIRSRDTEYPFCQDKYFYYLTGFNEPDAVLLLLSENPEQNQPAKSILFCHEKDPHTERWHGRRMGTQLAPKQLQIDSALPLKSLSQELTQRLSGTETLYWAQGDTPEKDSIIAAVLAQLRAGERQDLFAPRTICDWRPILDEMRLFKSDAEIQLIEQAIAISAAGHLSAIKQCKPSLMEYQLQSYIEHNFGLHGCPPAYASIVGGGDNACILHYTENSDALQDQQLVLIDAGAEYQGYAGDITRTLPVNGQFNTAQRQLYQLVLDTQLSAIALMLPGNTLQQVQDACIKQLTKGMLELGILNGDSATLIKEEAYKSYYMHGIGHWLGLDVHDVGSYGGKARSRPFKPGMVLTVEPGIYIDSNADVPSQYKGIGVRIEDNLLITPDGNRVLSQQIPKTIDEIEQIMASHAAGRVPLG